MQAVDDFYVSKFGSGGIFGKVYAGPHPHKNREDVLPGYDTATEQTVEITKAYCNYIYETYGRFPATFDPISMPIWLQAHHLETEWYDKYQIDGIISENHRQHMKRWHSS